MWEEAEKFLMDDRYIAPLINKYGHCTIRPRNSKYYFEDLVDAIVQQQLSIKAASSIFNRLKDALVSKRNTFTKVGVKHKWRELNTQQIDITPDKILKLTENTLRNCGLSRAKTLYIRDLSQKTLNGELHIDKLNSLSDSEVVGELIKVKGIGEWTAHMFLMFTLGRPDIFPFKDLGIRNAFEKIIKKGQSIKQMEKTALRWKPFRTVASWYLWRGLEN